MSPEKKKKKREESTKQWSDKQSPEKKEELRQKARDYKKTGIKTIWYRSKSSREWGALLAAQISLFLIQNYVPLFVK